MIWAQMPQTFWNNHKKIFCKRWKLTYQQKKRLVSAKYRKVWVINQGHLPSTSCSNLPMATNIIKISDSWITIRYRTQLSFTHLLGAWKHSIGLFSQTFHENIWGNIVIYNVFGTFLEKHYKLYVMGKHFISLFMKHSFKHIRR